MYFILKRFYERNRSQEQREKSFGDMLPYLYHYDQYTVVTKKNELMCVIKLNGFSFEAADDEDVESKKIMRNNLFKGMNAGGLSLYFHTIRRNYAAFPEGEFDNVFTKRLNYEWKMAHRPERTFINEHYITIIKQGPDKKATILKDLFERIRGRNAKENIDEKLMKEAHADIVEIRDRIVNGFNQYKATLLGIRSNQNGNFSEVCEFLGKIANLGYKQNMLVPRGRICDYINTKRLYFGSKVIEVFSANYHKYASMISIKEYRPATYAGILDGFLRMPCELIITQSYTFTDRMSAISKMQLQQRRLMQAEDVAISQVAEIDEALDSAMSGVFAFGLHHCTVMCVSDDMRILDNLTSQAIVEFANIGVMAVRENLNLEPAFWAQFPGNGDFAVRKSTINTLNLSGYASFHNYPSGQLYGNFWGNAVTVMNTTSGTPYFFNFHTRDVGHTMIIGPTGGGKTMLLNFLAAQAQKFKPKLFFFDKDRGAELFIRAINGNYTIINPGKVCNLNPLFLDDTPENRNFLVEWVKVLVSTNNEVVTAEEVGIINNAIDGIYRLPKHERRLRNLSSFLGLETGNSMAVRLKMWHSDGAKAKVFDNDYDMLDFSTNKTFSFDMAEIMKDKTALTPVLLYIFHKINLSLDGTPTMVVLDEAWALIDNPVFAPKIKDWLKVMRKMNAFVVFATQSVEDAAKSSISDTLVQQTATQIFLPNLKATPVYMSTFMLSKREYALIKNTDPSSRFFLIRQDMDGVIARVNLNGMTDMINILSGRMEFVKMAESIIKEYGNDPERWLPIFFERARNNSKPVGSIAA
jgi:type IV secretion system protein VirB4